MPCEVKMSNPSPITPDYYHIEFDDGLALRVLLREHPSGERPYVELFVGTGVFRKPVDAPLKTVEAAAIDIADELEALAASLRRMAPLLHSREST
jgi:hypothetical protein